MRHFLILGLLPITLVACGGATADDDGGNNSPSVLGGSGGEGTKPGPGGSSSAGAPSTGGSGGAGGYGVGGGSVGGWGGAGIGGWGPGGAPSTGGVAPTGGVAGTGAGGLACCLALAMCAPGDIQLDGPEACPATGECYSNTICCSTVWCQRATAVDGGSACDPSLEFGRQYVASSPEECALVDFMCPANTSYFGNACGCGCEQDPSCPEWIDCMPGPDANPGCSTEELAKCPYTQIAY